MPYEDPLMSDVSQDLPTNSIQPQSKEGKYVNITKGIQFGFINIQHLHPKLDQIPTLINRNGRNVDIFGCCETFLNDTYQNLEITVPLYNTIRRDRLNKAGGGIAIYINENIPFNRRNELECDYIEAIWIELVLPFTKNILVCAVYRPPNSRVIWYGHCHEMISKAYSSCMEIIMIGDFNIDYLHANIPSCWNEIISHFNFKQLVNMPTRVTEHTASIIDHIYATNENHICDIDVPNIRLSDHFPVYFNWKNNLMTRQTIPNSHKSVVYRSIDNINTSLFFNDLRSFDRTRGELSSPDEALSNWERSLKRILDKHAPKKQKRIKRESQPSWINATILNAMKSRDSAKRNEPDLYRFWRNKVTCLIRSAKQNYFKKEISKNVGNTKEIWKI